MVIARHQMDEFSRPGTFEEQLDDDRMDLSDDMEVQGNPIAGIPATQAGE